MLTLEQFRATGQDCADLRALMEVEHDEALPGRTYANNCYIEGSESAGWSLTISNMGFHGTLATLESYLHRLHYIDNCDDAPLADRLAADFANLLHGYFRADQWAEMRQRNATPEYGGSVCASHDFCDANMVMLEAFEKHGQAAACHLTDGSAEHEASCVLWGEAWAIAKRDYLTDC